MKRNKFSLSHYKLLTCNQGQLVPIGLTEVLPGDTVQHATSALIRVSPLFAPVMHPVHARIHHWFVPHRLVWEDWEDFITGGSDGMDESVFPTISLTPNLGTLADYLGVPIAADSRTVSALPFRGYSLIFNEWYRDQDLTGELPIDYTSGVDTTTNFKLQNVAWEKDYFTSARPWTQKGPEITIPLGTSAPVVTTNDPPTLTGSGVTNSPMFGFGPSTSRLGATAAFDGSGTVAFGNVTGLETDLTNASAVDVNELRLALALQRYEEARARYGSRYVEYLRYLGVKSADARLQRPEYLGGGKQTIQFSEVLQTAMSPDSENDSGVGNMFGHGIAAMRSNRYRRFFEEHGYVFSFISVQPRTMYMNGISRTWNRRTKEDFWQKELQHIGQQAILNKELYMQGTPDDDQTFGYQDRYDEYRRMESTVAGEFRSMLNQWHMARSFSALPTLNNDFVTSNPTNRIYANTITDQLYIMASHNIQARRMLSKTGTSFIY